MVVEKIKLFETTSSLLCGKKAVKEVLYLLQGAFLGEKMCLFFTNNFTKGLFGRDQYSSNKSLKSLMRSFDFVMKSFRCLILPDFAISQRSSGKTETLAAISAAISCQPFVVQVQAR